MRLCALLEQPDHNGLGFAVQFEILLEFDLWNLLFHF